MWPPSFYRDITGHLASHLAWREVLVDPRLESPPAPPARMLYVFRHQWGLLDILALGRALPDIRIWSAQQSRQHWPLAYLTDGHATTVDAVGSHSRELAEYLLRHEKLLIGLEPAPGANPLAADADIAVTAASVATALAVSGIPVVCIPLRLISDASARLFARACVVQGEPCYILHAPDESTVAVARRTATQLENALANLESVDPTPLSPSHRLAWAVSATNPTSVAAVWRRYVNGVPEDEQATGFAPEASASAQNKSWGALILRTLVSLAGCLLLAPAVVSGLVASLMVRKREDSTRWPEPLVRGIGIFSHIAIFWTLLAPVLGVALGYRFVVIGSSGVLFLATSWLPTLGTLWREALTPRADASVAEKQAVYLAHVAIWAETLPPIRALATGELQTDRAPTTVIPFEARVRKTREPRDKTPR